MGVRNGEVLASKYCSARSSSRCSCTTTHTNHDVTKRSLALLVLAASLYSADALSVPGRRLFRRPATSTELVLLRGDNEVMTSSFHEDDLSGNSPAFSSPLFTSTTHRRQRRVRQRVVNQHRRKLSRREGDFQLNYKDVDEDLDLDVLTIMESHQPVGRGIFRWRKRKSLSKALFPPLEEVDMIDDDIVVEDELNLIQETVSTEDVQEEVAEVTADQLPTFPRPIGIASKLPLRKKKPLAVVSNIHELHEAVLDKGFELRDIELKYSPPPSLLTSKKQNQTDTSDNVQVVFMTQEVDTPYSGEAYEMEMEFNIQDDSKEPNAEEWQLIGNVLAENNPVLQEEENEEEAVDQAEKLFSHDVLNLLHQRYHSQSTPMSRAPGDTATLALSIEGGGMRGAVSGGMAAAIACLGLSNAFDSIYGSSAGSIIGSYFVSRQLYLDVYTDVIPAGKDLFVSKPKIIGDIFRNMYFYVKGPLGKRLNANLIERFRNPLAAGANATQAETLPPTRAGGLNTSFVLDSIMCPENGLRPLDMEVFAHNDAVQPLRIVSSAVEMETGKLKSVCFGSKEGHFKDSFGNPAAGSSATDNLDYLYPEIECSQVDENGNRRGFWGCLDASMSVPGAAGSPLQMNLPSSKTNEPTLHLCFDAFCYEPVPFRAAVAEGATHVLALRSRPAGYEPKTKPTLYERAVAPLYFRSHGVNTVAEFFENGGQQYLYAEDVLMLDQGLNSSEPIPISPARVLYANPEAASAAEKDRATWDCAHLLPITVAADVPELAVLSQDRDDILEAIRSGFAAAYDALAPVVGLETGPDSLGGMKVAELVFPEADAPHESVMQMPLAGEKLGRSLSAATEQEIISATYGSGEAAASADLSSPPRRKTRLRRLLSTRSAFRSNKSSSDQPPVEEVPLSKDAVPLAKESDSLFSFLPGVQLGTLPMVAERLQTYLENHSYMES